MTRQPERCLCIRRVHPSSLETEITFTLLRTARFSRTVLSLPFHQFQIPCSLGVFLLRLIVFFRVRLRNLGLCNRDHRFLLHWLIRLDYRFLLRRGGLLRIAMLRVAIFLI